MDNIKGIMWFENDKKKPLEQILEEAAAYAFDKIGIGPKVVYVNMHQYPDERTILNMHLVPVPHVMVNHYWMCEK